jgi:hypothetical protein
MLLKEAALAVPLLELPTATDYERRIAVERQLADTFPQAVADIAFEDAVILSPGVSELSEHAKTCGLVAITNAHYPVYPNSEHRVRKQDVVCGESVDPAARIDRSFAIALHDRGQVMAFASGYVPYPENGLTDVSITQIQGRRLRGHMRALFGGFDWKETLINAWTTVARATPAQTIGVESAKRSKWAPSVGYLAAKAETGQTNPGWTAEEYTAKGIGILSKMLDKPADNMGFTYHEETKHWELALAA